MSAPLVSICIPCYNAAPWLGAALDSILAQSYGNIELIAVNDGSIDATADILASYEKKCARVIQQHNRGQSAAANVALAASRGEYVKFFDADDLLSHDAVALQVAALEQRPRHLACGIWGRFLTTPNEAQFTPHPGWHTSDNPIEWLCETWRDTEPMYQCGLWLIPRCLLDTAGGWDERLSLINDFEFFTRLVLTSAGIVHTPEARVYYRSGLPGSLSAQKSRQAWESAHLSTVLSVRRLLAREDTAQTRRLAANMLQKLLYSFYPEHADLRRSIEAYIRHLGGSDRTPDGGPWFRKLASFVGWRFAARMRYQLGRRPR